MAISQSHIYADTLANRPAFGVPERYYWTTDEHILYRDTGAAWVKVAVADYPDLDSIPATFAPAAHKDTHDPEDGADPLDAAAPGAISEAASAEGTSHSLARADHNHQHTAALHENGGGAELDVVGLSGLLADDQHVLDAEVLLVAAALLHKDRHDPEDGADPLDAAAPGAISEAANAEGSSHSFARSDHNHQHTAALHENGGGAEISLAGLDGESAELATHKANTTTAHGAVSAATANKHVVRDASARAKFAAPGAAGDALIKGTRVTTAELPAMTDEKIWKGTGGNVEEVDMPSGGYTEGARAYHNANQAIPNITETIIAFNSERYDTDVIHDNAVNNSRLTCKTAGKYLIVGNISWLANVAGRRQHVILLNNLTRIAKEEVGIEDVTGSHSPLISTIYDLSVNDFVELRIYHSAGAPLDIVAAGANGEDSQEFMMQRIG